VLLEQAIPRGQFRSVANAVNGGVGQGRQAQQAKGMHAML
jgi:hypothetical protein